MGENIDGDVHYMKLNRTTFKDTMPDNLKKSFILLVQQHPALTKELKDFVCDVLQNYESMSEHNRSECLDVIDEMQLFVSSK